MTLQEVLTKLERTELLLAGTRASIDGYEHRLVEVEGRIRDAERGQERAEASAARGRLLMHNGALENDRLRNAHELIVLKVAEYQRQDKYAIGLVHVGRIAFAALNGEVPE